MGHQYRTRADRSRPSGEQYPKRLDRGWRPRIRAGLRLVSQKRIPVRQVRQLHHVHERPFQYEYSLTARGQARGLHLARWPELQVLVIKNPPKRFLRTEPSVRIGTPGRGLALFEASRTVEWCTPAPDS